jgi:outer membrane protein OmpA-like peptidoglycan-associated protein
MKKIVAGILLIVLSVTVYAQIQSGTFYFDKSFPNYTLDKNDGKRSVEYEVTFPKPFERKPRLVLSPTLIDAENGTQIRYTLEAKGVSRDGFLLMITTWGSTRINGIGGYWLAEAEKLELKKEEITVGETFQLNNVLFEFNKWVLLPSSSSDLDKVVKFLSDNPKVEIELSGHTDNIGKPDYNLDLSQKRADAVKNYVVSKGIDGKRIVAKGYGMNKPVSTNSTESGREQNRRVEFTVTKK